MPVPSKKESEDKKSFMSRCMSDETMNKEYPDQSQRSAVCMSKATEDCGCVEAADFKLYFDLYGSEEEITEDNFYVPLEAEYEDAGEDTEEWDISEAKPGLWENIRKKKEREGKNYKPAKPGDPDRPDPDSWKKAQKPKDKSESHNAGSMEKYVFESKEEAEKMAKKIGLSGVHSHKTGDGKTMYMPGKNMQEFKSWYDKHSSKAAEYQGRKVTLNKPFLTPKGPKKRSVYVKNDKGNVVKVNFGDPKMKIKKNDPARRKSFRARHNCDNPGPKWKARYWSCKFW